MSSYDDNRTVTVGYQIATYSGTVDVRCNENDENHIIFARAKAKLRREACNGSLPFGYEVFWVEAVEDDSDADIT